MARISSLYKFTMIVVQTIFQTWYWCPTAVDDHGFMLHHNWGVCEDECKGDGAMVYTATDLQVRKLYFGPCRFGGVLGFFPFSQ